MPQIRLADRAKRRPRRLAKQILYSAKNREKMERLKRPNRDRVAKACLAVVLDRMTMVSMAPLENKLLLDIVIALIKEGFDADQCRCKVSALVEEARAAAKRSKAP